jgi:hypothetical protein
MWHMRRIVFILEIQGLKCDAQDECTAWCSKVTATDIAGKQIQEELCATKKGLLSINSKMMEQNAE